MRGARTRCGRERSLISWRSGYWESPEGKVYPLGEEMHNDVHPDSLPQPALRHRKIHPESVMGYDRTCTEKAGRIRSQKQRSGRGQFYLHA